jgi:hypothetical protein
LDKNASEHDARVAIIVENIITYGGAHISVVVRYNNTETNDFEDYEAQETVYGTDHMELSIVVQVHSDNDILFEMTSRALGVVPYETIKQQPTISSPSHRKTLLFEKNGRVWLQRIYVKLQHAAEVKLDGNAAEHRSGLIPSSSCPRIVETCDNRGRDDVDKRDRRWLKNLDASTIAPDKDLCIVTTKILGQKIGRRRLWFELCRFHA